MKKFIFTLLFGAAIAGSYTSNATLLNVGDSVADITMTDINGNTFTLYSYLDQGYTVLVDISATWCPPCWAYEQTHVSQTMYEKYGPTGTVTPKKFITIFIEGDPQTNNADLHGTGANTQGDWVTGNDYPIVDFPDQSYISTFLNPNTTSYAYPTFVVICPDRKVIWTGEGYGPSMNESFFTAKMDDCPTSTPPSGIGSVMDFSTLTVYPNPVSDQLNLTVSVSAQTQATLSITNVIGQEVTSKQVTFRGGEQTEAIGTEKLQSGIYILTISTPDGNRVQRKFTKQ